MDRNNTPGQRTENNDVVLLLKHQHEQIRRLLHAVTDRTGIERKRAFHELVHLLTIHEIVEEEVIHPRVRRIAGVAEETVARRLEEEREIKESLSRVEKWGPDDPRFAGEFRSLREDFLAHAESEEIHEFAALREDCTQAELQVLAKTTRIAGVFAPTHPHRDVDSASKNLALRPATALVDRTRDALHTAHDGLVWLRSWYVH